MGGIEIRHSGEMRACFQRKGGGKGRPLNICGPCRGEKRKAEEDLEAIRAAAAHGEDAWVAMAAEARRLQERVHFKKRVAVLAAGYTNLRELNITPASYQPLPPIFVADPRDAVEASALLSKFRPARMSTEDLKKLLDARADPNITLPGSIHPLFKVMTFASAEKVGPMRDLLLQAGAIETDEAKERWALRRSTDATEKAWLRNFPADPSLVPYMCP